MTFNAEHTAVKHGINIIGPGFKRTGVEAAGFERRKQRNGDGRFAAAGDGQQQDGPLDRSDGCLLLRIELQTVRMETWMNTGTKEEPSFVPLDAIGEAF